MKLITRNLHEEARAYAFLAPSLLILAALLLYPLGSVIRLSFYEANIVRETWIGLGNYIALLDDAIFWRAFWQTILFTAGSVILHFVIGLGLALLLNEEINRRWRAAARGILIVPWLLAPTVAGMIWVLMLAPFGVVNALFQSLGIVDAANNIPWLGQPSTSLLSVTLMNVWRAFPFFMVMLLAGLQAIPQQLYEAAEIDGATLWQRFRFVTLPSLRSVIATVVLLDSIWTFRAFDPVYVMTGGGPTHSSEVLATAIYFSGFQNSRFGYASAEAVVMFVVLLVVSAFYVRRALANVH
jgi:multiple sugar transport system permease protein